ncbi:hypothetical protein DMC30DRAFT_40746 [Rhodotorula diobovata]|uniref:Uncharacterized protein n=1 Tax=Rhodotorula diobovata TaxID=5288 RepID=A0A5C5FQ19_9BASI|nr:hypothetical protein DMC30DRAFT_40746 [Rhodotorula diobovata]
MRTSTKMQEMAKRSASGGTRKKKVVIAGQPIEKFVCSLAGRGRPVDKKDDFIISITGKQEADRILDELVAAGQKYREDKEPNPEARIEEPKSTEDVKEFKQAVALVGKVDVRHVAVITEDTDFGCTNTAETFGFVCAMQCRGLNAKLELDVTDKWQEDGKDEDPQDGDDKKDGDDKTMGGGAKKSASSGAAGTGLAGAQTSETGGTSTRRRVQKKKKSWRNPAVSRNGDKFLPRPALRAMLWSASGLDSILGPDRGRRLRIVVLVGSDYSGDGLFGFTWSLVESGIAKDVYNEPWTTAEELQQRLQTLVDRLASQKAADVAWRASGAAGTVRKPSHQVDVSVKFAQTLIDAVKTFELDQSIQLVDRSTPSSMIDFRLTFDPPLAPDRQRTTGGPDATNTTNASGGAGAPGTSGRIARGSAGSPIAGRRRRSGQGRRREGASSGGESSEGGDERVSDNGNEAAAGDGDEAMKEPATGGAPPPHPLRPEANEFIMRDGKQHHPEHPFARPDGARAHKPSRLRHCPLPLDCSVVLAAEAYGPEPVLAEYVYGEEIEAVDVDGTARDQDKDEDEDQASETGSDDDGDGDSDRKATASGRRPRLKDVFEVVSSWAVPLDGAFRVLCSRATTSTGADGGKVRAEATPRRPYGRNGRERARTKRLREKGWASYPGSRRTASVKPLVAQDDPVEKDAPVPSLQAASPHGASVHPTSPAAAASRSPSSSPHAPSSPDPKERYPAHEFPQHQSRAPAKLVRLFHFAAVMQNATVMAAQKEYIVAQVLKSSDKGYKVLGENAVERHGVARVMAKLKAEAQRGRHGTVATKTPAEVTAAARRAVEAGHYRPAFMGGEAVDAEIYKPFATVYKEDLTTKPIELERLGNFLASNLLANFPVALEGVLRTSHRTLEVPSIVADAFKDASPEAQVDFAVAIRPILVNLLVDTPFSRASAEAGRDDAAPPQVGEQRRSARGVAQQGQRARELAVEAPPLTLTQNDQKALREAVRRINDESKFIHACDSLVIEVMKRLLAQRDVAFANGLNVQFLTAEEQRVIRAKYPSAASFARKADARFDQNMAKAYVSAAGLTGDGNEAWDRIKSQSFAEMFDGLPEKAKLRSAALILWTRLARGEHDKVLPVLILTQVHQHERHGPLPRLAEGEPAPLHQ